MSRMRRILGRGFTLVELLVVIGIIATLAALVVAVGSGVLTRGERTLTESAVTTLEMAIVELEQGRGQPLTFNRRTSVTDETKQDGLPFRDVDELPPGFVNEAYIMPRLVALLAANPACWSELSAISPDLLRRERRTWADGVTTEWNLRDAWGEQLAVVPCGRAATRSEIRAAREASRGGGSTRGADPLGIGIDLDDGTVRTTDEWSLNTGTVGRRWLFLSRGPDRFLGMPPWGPGGLAARVYDADGDGRPDWDDNLTNFEPRRLQP
jgi:prepilin-type N-terminal cleavage/methylation domain-containing protein